MVGSDGDVVDAQKPTDGADKPKVGGAIVLWLELVVLAAVVLFTSMCVQGLKYALVNIVEEDSRATVALLVDVLDVPVSLYGLFYAYRGLVRSTW